MSVKSVVVLLLLTLYSIFAYSKTGTQYVEDGGQFHITLGENEFLVIKLATWTSKYKIIECGLTAGQIRRLNELKNHQMEDTNELKNRCDLQNGCISAQKNSGIVGHNGMIAFMVKYEYGRFCPHSAFVGKHIAPEPTPGMLLTQVAQDKEKLRIERGWQTTEINSIFIGAHAMTYRIIENGRYYACQFERAATKRQCFQGEKVIPAIIIRSKPIHTWSCPGDEATVEIASHNTETGHLSSNRIRDLQPIASSSTGANLTAFLKKTYHEINPLDDSDWLSFLSFKTWSFAPKDFFPKKSQKIRRTNDRLEVKDRIYSLCHWDDTISTIFNTNLLDNIIETPYDYLLPLQSTHWCEIGKVYDEAGNRTDQIYIYLMKYMHSNKTIQNTFVRKRIIIIGTVKEIISDNVHRTDTIDRRTTFTYDYKNHHLIVKGENISVSNVVNNKNWNNADTIDVFALNNIVIDVNINRIGDGAKLTFFAPNWTIKFPKKITLDGANASNYSNSANNAIGEEVKGDNGKPGLPGGTAGHFFGAAITFENSHLLSIRAIGGKGGTGQTGGKGSPGINGEDANIVRDRRHDPLESIKFAYNCTPEKTTWGAFDDIFHDKTCLIHGTHIVAKPGDGGNGGISGFGGNGGQIILLGATTASRQYSQSGEFCIIKVLDE